MGDITNYRLRDTTTIGELLTFENNKRKPISQNERINGIYPYYGGTGIVDYINEYSFDEERLLIGEDGANCGYAFIVNGKYNVNNHAHVTYSEKDNIIFIKEYINYTNLSKYTEGYAIPKLTLNDIKSVRIPVFSLKEQNDISEIFNSLDNVIDMYSKQKELLEQKKKHYLNIIFNDKNGDNYRLGENVELVRLGDLSTLITKGTTPKNKSVGEVNFIKVESIINKTIDLYKCESISEYVHCGELKRSKLKENDILISIAGTLGRTTIIKKHHLPANTNQALAIIRGYEGNINVLQAYFESEKFKDWIRKNLSVGAQPNLSLDQINNIKLNKNIIYNDSLGLLFSNLDSLITKYTKQKELLEKKKKHYLNVIFNDKIK